MITIAVDAMGGDSGTSVTVPAAITTLKKYQDVAIQLYGDEREITNVVATLSLTASERSKLSILHTDETVEMDELPSSALRSKRQSSMRLAINAVKEQRADACVSAGNTGALVAMSKFVLKTFDGIQRPAICAQLPSVERSVYALDLGANVESPSRQLVQFAVMGSVFAEVLEGVQQPSVGLVNVGEEEIKGIARIKAAHAALLELPINYFGFVEGNDLYSGKVNVVVMDGFEGNIALKSSEGLARMIRTLLSLEFKRNWLTRTAAVFAYPVLKRLALKMSPSNYNGACLLGLRGLVVKSHGGATVRGFERALEVAYAAAAENTVDRIKQKLMNV